MDNVRRNKHKMETNVMRECSRKWNLSADVDLLKKLEEFSQHVLDNTTLALNCMDSLEENLNKTFLNVRTITNNFHAIADNQFIENRVQEEEDSMFGNEITSMEWSAERSELQFSLHQSLKNCAEILEKKFKEIDIAGSDSEDEGTMGRQIMLIPESAYKERPFPYLIGSAEFIADDSLGLSALRHDDDEASETDDEIRQDPLIYTSTASEHPNSSEPNKIQGIQQPQPLSSVQINFSVVNPVSTSRVATEDNNPLGQNKFELPKSSETSEVDAASIKTVSRSKELVENASSPSIGGENVNDFKANLSRILSQRGERFVRQPSLISASETPKNDHGNHSEDNEENENQMDVESSSSLESLYLKNENKVPVSQDSSKQTSLKDTIGTDPILPNISTKVLPSLGKERPKIQAKRRLPSRKHRKGNFYNNIDRALPNESDSMNAVLSPSTDEEDLFLLPAFDFPKDISSTNLFLGNTLLSPGMSIDSDKTPVPKTDTLLSHEVNGFEDLMESEPDESDPLSQPQSDDFSFRSNLKFNWEQIDSPESDNIFSVSEIAITHEHDMKTNQDTDEIAVLDKKIKTEKVSIDKDLFYFASTSKSDSLDSDLFSNTLDDSDEFLPDDIFGSSFKTSLHSSKLNKNDYLFKSGENDDDDDDDKLFSSGLSHKEKTNDDFYKQLFCHEDDKKNGFEEESPENLFSASPKLKDPLLFSNEFT